MTTYCSENYKFSYLDSPEFLIASLHILGCLSIPVHMFGAYCILFITPKTMESVKIAMLNYHFLTFLTDLMFSVLATPYFLAPSFIASAVGIFEKLGVDPILQMCSMVIFHEILFFSIVQILENRYMVICDVHWIWKKVRVPWLIWSYATIPFFSLPIYLAAPENPLLSKSEALEVFISVIIDNLLIFSDIFVTMFRIVIKVKIVLRK
ncbi:hypothetical protein B9Z55_021405 [Caenorhabditis nigoni]|uniref:7TM GPCR serpentine receptor class x (Srx) domain-containing protein n=1 Tax=Caenorhabditis nigoni TaxID=1611254 RepID=A0A2G5TRZ6_9PELO|nr:hypothetical protein B9Z55_021405 [Caenorhabditis nigoni]